MTNTRRSRCLRSALFLVLMIPLYGQDCCSDQVSNDPCRAYLEQGGLCQLVADRTNDFDPCPLTGGGNGWCYNGECVTASLCWPGKCYDEVECTVDLCDPADGTCSNTVDPQAFLECDNENGICVGSTCNTTDPCLREDYGRINCCADIDCRCPQGDCSGTVDVATTCTNPLPVVDGNGDPIHVDCDPTGVEAPGASPNQAGHCVASGECVWDSGPCADKECQDQLDCTKESCDPATGACRPVEIVAPGLQCDGFGGRCAGSWCRVDGCAGEQGYTECCAFCDNADGFCDLEWSEGESCTPGGFVVGGSTNLDGICVVTPAGERFKSDCVPTACAEPDPDDQVPDEWPLGWRKKDCDDGLPCTVDSCDPDTGACVHTSLPTFTFCDDGFGACLPDGTCTPLADPCDGAGALCHPCTEQGILDAIAAGGGPHEFACASEWVELSATLVIDNDVILDGEDVLTIKGVPGLTDFIEVSPGVTAEIRGVTLFDGRRIQTDGDLTLMDTHVIEVSGGTFPGSPIQNGGDLTIVRSVFERNAGFTSGVITNDGNLTILDSSLVDNRAASTAGVGGGALTNNGTALLTNTTIAGNEADSVLENNTRVAAGGIYNTGTLTLVGSTVQGNTNNEDGGGIVTDGGSVTLEGSVVSSNQADGDGGGIYAIGGSQVFVTQSSSVEGNTAGNEGGGVFVLGGSQVTISGSSSIEGNTAAEIGGGVRVYQSSLSVTDSTIASNLAVSSAGGGISSYADAGGATTVDIVRSTIADNEGLIGGGVLCLGQGNTLTIEQSAVVGNVARLRGGGVHVWNGGTATLSNSTFAQNDSFESGGALRVVDGQVEVVHCTFEANTSEQAGDAIGLIAGGVTIQNSILADECSGGPTSLGGNLELDTDTCGFGAGDAIVTTMELKLGSLDLWAGPTLNYRPKTDSTAVDFAACVPGVTTEQRGINTRPQGPLCDSGSVERP